MTSFTFVRTTIFFSLLRNFISSCILLFRGNDFYLGLTTFYTTRTLSSRHDGFCQYTIRTPEKNCLISVHQWLSTVRHQVNQYWASSATEYNITINEFVKVIILKVIYQWFGGSLGYCVNEHVLGSIPLALTRRYIHPSAISDKLNDANNIG